MILFITQWNSLQCGEFLIVSFWAGCTVYKLEKRKKVPYLVLGLLWQWFYCNIITQSSVWFLNYRWFKYTGIIFLNLYFKTICILKVHVYIKVHVIIISKFLNPISAIYMHLLKDIVELWYLEHLYIWNTSWNELEVPLTDYILHIFLTSIPTILL